MDEQQTNKSVKELRVRLQHALLYMYIYIQAGVRNRRTNSKSKEYDRIITTTIIIRRLCVVLVSVTW